MPANDRRLVLDSPWFWLLLFALFALAMLIVFGDKYRHRQSQLERQFQSKELRDAREFDAKPASDNTTFSSPDNLIMPLWPLASLLIVMAFVSAAMLFRASRRAAASTSEGPHA